MYKEVYYAHRCTEADREADKVTTKRSLTAKREAREKLNVDLANQQAVWAAERATLLRDKEAAEQELQLAKAQAMDTTLLLKEAVEINMRTQKDLCIQTDQVYELRWQQHSSGSQPPL